MISKSDAILFTNLCRWPYLIQYYTTQTFIILIFKVRQIQIINFPPIQLYKRQSRVIPSTNIYRTKHYNIF